MRIQYAELIFIALFCVYRGTKEKVFMNPFMLFVLTPVSLLIYNHNVNTYYLLALEKKIYIMAIYNMLAFLIVLNHKIIPDKGNTISDNIMFMEKYSRWGIRFVIISFLPDIFALFFHSSMPLGAFFSILLYLGITFAMKSEIRRTKVTTYILLVIKLLLSFNKTVVLLAVITIMCAITTGTGSNNNKKMKYILPLVLIMSYFFIIYAFPLKTYFRLYGSFSGLNSIDELYSITDDLYENYSDNWSFDSSLFIPYMSLITPWTNLNYVINTQPGHSYGLWIIKPILGFLQINTSNIEAYKLQPMHGSFNTFGFLTVQYKDFGKYGAIMITALLAIFVSYSYNSYVKKQWNPIIIAEYSLVACAVFEMFYSNHFFSQGYTQAGYIVSYLILVIMSSFDKKLYRHLKGYDTIDAL